MMNPRGFLPKRTITQILVAISLLSILILSLASCTSDETRQGATSDKDVYPDTLPSVSEAYFSEAIDENGTPVNVTDAFTIDTPEIFFFLVLSFEGVCCSTVTIQWIYDGIVIDMWQDYSTYPSVISLKSPEGGFAMGKYEVTVYIELTQIIRIPFTIGL
jgi:hypothetical protein